MSELTRWVEVVKFGRVDQLVELDVGGKSGRVLCGCYIDNGMRRAKFVGVVIIFWSLRFWTGVLKY